MKIQFSCPQCLKQFQVAGQYAGRSTRCTACGSVLSIPVPGRYGMVPARSAAGPGGDVPLAGRERPRQGRYALVGLLLVLSSLVLLASAYGAWKGGLFGKAGQIMPGGSPLAGPAPSSLDAHFLPEDAANVLVVNLDTIFASKMYRKYKEAARQDEPGNTQLSGMIRIGPDVGLPMSDVRRITAASPSQDNEAVVMVVRSQRAVTAAEMAGKLKGGPFTPVPAGRYTMHQGTTNSFCVADDRTVVIAVEAARLRQVLERDRLPTFGPALQEALKLINPAKAFAFAAAPQEMQKNKKPPKPGVAVIDLTDQLPALKPLKDARTFGLEVDVSNGFAVYFTLSLKDAADAQAFQKSIEAGLAFIKNQANNPQKPLSVEEEALRKRFLEALDRGYRLTVRDNVLTGSLALDSDLTVALLEQSLKSARTSVNDRTKTVPR